MASEEMGLFSAQRLDNGLSPHPQLVFPESFSCGPPPPPHPRRNSAAAAGPGPKTTRELTGFLNNHRYFRPMPQAAADFRGPMFAHRWDDRDSSTPSGDGSDEDGDDDNEDEHGAECRVDVDNHDSIRKPNNNCSTDDSGNQKANDVPNFSSKEGSLSGSSVDEARNALAVAEPNGGMYYMQGSGSNLCQRDIMVGDKGCGYSGRRESSSSYSSEIGESLRAILSDPVSGALMDDAVILPCGHSFGSVGAQHVVRMKACYNCAQPVSEESIAPNLSLRAAVQAFRREEDFQVNLQSRRRKEKHDQDKGTCGDSMLSDHPRGRGVHFPFAVTDRVIIKGNKRTPLRFVGREAVVTTQCLNGWYVVKTLDNAESVKLQYRSLAKAAPDSYSSPQPISCSKPSSSWL